MSVPTLAHPGPDRPRGPRSRALRTCPDGAVPHRAPAPDATPSTGPTAQEAGVEGSPPDAAGHETTRPPTGPRGRRPRFALAHVPLLVLEVATRLSGGGRRIVRALLKDDSGMSTVEYAIGTVAAAAFGVVLYTVVTGDSILTALTGLVQRALQIEF
ncbi:DUF4244 domain-containing protein [Pseudonocardia xishanensis]